MNTKQKEQLKKTLIFSGLGLLFALSLWFIFSPSEKGKSAKERALNDSIPQATTEQLTENKLKAYELSSDMERATETQDEMGRLSDYFAENTAEQEEQGAQTTDQIESSLQRYEENNRLVSSFYEPDPYDEERQELLDEIAYLQEELSRKESNEESEEEKQLALMEKSYQMAAKYLPVTTSSARPASPQMMYLNRKVHL